MEVNVLRREMYLKERLKCLPPPVLSSWTQISLPASQNHSLSLIHFPLLLIAFSLSQKCSQLNLLNWNKNLFWHNFLSCSNIYMIPSAASSWIYTFKISKNTYSFQHQDSYCKKLYPQSNLQPCNDLITCQFCSPCAFPSTVANNKVLIFPQL